MQSSNSHNTSYSWEQFICSRLHSCNCWTGTVDSWGLRLWGRQWSCSDS